MVPFFISFRMSILVAKIGQIWFNFWLFFVSILAFFSLDLGVIWVSFGIFLGLHEGLLVGLWRQKPLNI